MEKWSNRATNTNRIGLTDLTAYMEGFEIKRLKHGTERAIVGSHQELINFLTNEIKLTVRYVNI